MSRFIPQRLLLAFALTLGLAVVTLLPPALPALAEEADEDHETARKALENKEILPLGRVLALIEGQFQGDVIEIELERKKGIWVYELDLIDTGGRVREIHVDARNGEVLKIEFEE